jgi:hypothetical protein
MLALVADVGSHRYIGRLVLRYFELDSQPQTRPTSFEL